MTQEAAVKPPALGVSLPRYSKYNIPRERGLVFVKMVLAISWRSAITNITQFPIKTLMSSTEGKKDCPAIKDHPSPLSWNLPPVCIKCAPPRSLACIGAAFVREGGGSGEFHVLRRVERLLATLLWEPPLGLVGAADPVSFGLPRDEPTHLPACRGRRIAPRRSRILGGAGSGR